MSIWRVQLFGPLVVQRDGVPVRLRTRQQALLLARLVAHAPDRIDRVGTALALWPDANRSNALAYLRRALMELKELGLAIASSGDNLAIEAGAVDSDLDSPSAQSRPVLEGLEHPLAEEIRTIAIERRARVLVPPPKTGESASVEAWMLDALLRERPDVALDLIAEHGDKLLVERPPEETLRLCQRALAASQETEGSRAKVAFLAARACDYLTRYGLASRYYEACLEAARKEGDLSLETRAVSFFSIVHAQTRQWEKALDLAWQGVRLSEKLDDPNLASSAYNNLAGIQWHLLDFEGAEVSYGRGGEFATADRFRKTVRCNQAYLWAVFGVPVSPPIEMPERSTEPSGHLGAVECFYGFSASLGFGELRRASEYVARHLELEGAEGRERYLSVALDCAAIVLGQRGLGSEAAAVTRLGSRLRRSLDHGRSPAERLAIRRFVSGSYFAIETQVAMRKLDADEPQEIARHVARRLRASAVG